MNFSDWNSDEIQRTEINGKDQKKKEIKAEEPIQFFVNNMNIDWIIKLEQDYSIHYELWWRKKNGSIIHSFHHSCYIFLSVCVCVCLLMKTFLFLIFYRLYVLLPQKSFFSFFERVSCISSNIKWLIRHNLIDKNLFLCVFFFSVMHICIVP